MPMRIKSLGTLDVGNLCVGCFRDTSFGSGLFVNRVGSDKELEVECLDHRHEKQDEAIRLQISLDGWVCPECQQVQCDECQRVVLDEWESVGGGTFCTGCIDKLGLKQECS
jgi:hypothetical protein